MEFINGRLIIIKNVKKKTKNINTNIKNQINIPLANEQVNYKMMIKIKIFRKENSILNLL